MYSPTSYRPVGPHTKTTMNSDKLNQKLQKSISKCAQDWLTAALDPYHDYQMDLEGLPDERSAPSVVQMHNQSYTLTAPTSAAGGNWDASVLYTGFDSVIGNRCGMMAKLTASLHAYDHTSFSSGQPFGALTVWAGAAGSTQTNGAPMTLGDTNVSLGSALDVDRCRLIGVAFEVHNTTAEIYKQGSLTVAQLPDCATDAGSILYHDTASTDAYHDFTFQSDKGALKACTLQPLLAIPGSQTWPADKGVYAIPRMTEVPRKLAALSGGTSSGRTVIAYGLGGTGVGTLEPTGFQSDGSIVVPTIPVVSPSGFSPLQVYLSGLSSSTTLTITFRTIVEYFPALGSTLLPLATPSPYYEAKVFGLYGAIAARAPYAVPVGQNAAGDYFRKIAGLLSNALVLTSPMFGDLAPLAYAVGKYGTSKIQKLEAGARASAAKGKR